MLTKIVLSPNDNLKPAILVWDKNREDYVFESIPDGLSRMELFELSEEIAYLTRIDE